MVEVELIAEGEAAEAAVCDAGVPHFSQNFNCAVRAEPHFAQNRCTTADSAEAVRRAPHFVQNALFPFSWAPH